MLVNLDVVDVSFPADIVVLLDLLIEAVRPYLHFNNFTTTSATCIDI